MSILELFARRSQRRTYFVNITGCIYTVSHNMLILFDFLSKFKNNYCFKINYVCLYVIYFKTYIAVYSRQEPCFRIWIYDFRNMLI